MSLLAGGGPWLLGQLAPVLNRAFHALPSLGITLIISSCCAHLGAAPLLSRLSGLQWWAHNAAFTKQNL
jgi:hypothetical protein